MRVKLTGRLANARGNWEAGDVIVVSEAEGKALVACKGAVALQEPPVPAVPRQVPDREAYAPETASLEPEETAELPRARGGRRKPGKE